MRQPAQPTRQQFIRNLIGITLGLIVFSAATSWFLNFSFPILLFITGALASGLGGTLSGPDTYDLKSPHTQRLLNQNWQNQNLLKSVADQAHYNVHKAAPKYALEYALLYAGGIVLIISAPFICQIMYY